MQDIQPSDLELVRGANGSSVRICTHCGYEADRSFIYCPRCGQKL